MKPLLQIADQHATGTGVVGTVSGFLSVVLAELHSAAGLAADLGSIFACASSALCVAILWRKWRRNADHRRDFRRDVDPREDELL